MQQHENAMLLSSGKLVENPQLVMKYLEELKKRSIEIATVYTRSRRTRDS